MLDRSNVEPTEIAVRLQLADAPSLRPASADRVSEPDEGALCAAGAPAGCDRMLTHLPLFPLCTAQPRSTAMASAASSSSASASAAASPSYYFFQSPYLSKEFEACLRDRTRVAGLSQRGAARNLHRLRRGDMQCSFLIDEKQRPAVSKDNDRIFNAAGNNSFLTAAAANADGSKAAAASAVVPVLSTPTQPMLLYWTDGAKRTLPFLLLKSVALRRGAARLGITPSAAKEPITPDVLVRVLGGSNALDAKLLDDKCLMQRLLAHKSYVPYTDSFDITKAGWEAVVERAFLPRGSAQSTSAAAASSSSSSTAAAHTCTPSCSTDFLIFKPSLGHKQRGIKILPRCSLQFAAACSWVQSQMRPGGLKGRFETWVVQEYCMQPLTLSGMDIGLIWEHGEKWKQSGEWRKMMHVIPATTAAANEATNGQPVPSAKRAAPTSKAASSSSSSSAAAAAAPAPSTIRHTLTPSFPYLPSDSSRPVLARGLFKLHFRLYAMVVFDASTGRYETYYSNLSKVYHATEQMAEIELQQPLPPASADSNASEQQKRDYDAAAAYLFAQSSPDAAEPSKPFPPLSSLSPSILTLRSAFSTPSLSADISVSKYLTMRLAHHIFPAEKLATMFAAFAEIVKDTVRETVAAGGMRPVGGWNKMPASAEASRAEKTKAAATSSPAAATAAETEEATEEEDDDESAALDRSPSPPASSSASSAAPSSAASSGPPPGLSHSYFQFLGYDFLWDTASHRALLLEVNNNVGQGLMSQQTMEKQSSEATGGVEYGLSNAQYGLMRDYWRAQFRVPFVEGAMKINVDRLGKSPQAATATRMRPEAPRLPCTPPNLEENCWVLIDVIDRPQA